MQTDSGRVLFVARFPFCGAFASDVVAPSARTRGVRLGESESRCNEGERGSVNIKMFLHSLVKTL